MFKDEAMISNIQRPAALGLTMLALGSCSDQLTEPSQPEVTAVAEAAVAATTCSTSDNAYSKN
jgi:hypothetical protein